MILNRKFEVLHLKPGTEAKEITTFVQFGCGVEML
jgi:hypothetical protein